MPRTPSTLSPSSSGLATKIAQLAAAREQVRSLSVEIAGDLGLQLAGGDTIELPALSSRPATRTTHARPAPRPARSAKGSAKRPRKIKRRWRIMPDDVKAKIVAAAKRGDTQVAISKSMDIPLASIQNVVRAARKAGFLPAAGG